MVYILCMADCGIPCLIDPIDGQLQEESYTGLLVNHRTKTHGRTVTPVPEDEQYRHENFFPVIVDREEWEQVQALLKANAKPYHGKEVCPSHRIRESELDDRVQ